jgi:DNA-binding MarR family transcriptional regulator
LRAYRAYLDLLDTAVWFRGEMAKQLRSFDLTMGGFRILEMIHRDGPMSVVAAATRMRCERPNVEAMIDRLVEQGWLRRVNTSLPPVDIKPSHIAIARRGLPRRGRRITLLRLTPSGREAFENVFPHHVKVVKSFMRVLDGHEQETLSRLLQKVREGDILRLLQEIRMRVAEEEE